MNLKSFFDYERLGEPLISRTRFLRRIAKNLRMAGSIVCLSLFLGMCGYRYFEGYQWIDAFLSASMILSGMGPVGPVESFSGKLFAGLFALYSGLMLIIVTGLLVSPVIHRMMHTFHLQDGEGGDDDEE